MFDLCSSSVVTRPEASTEDAVLSKMIGANMLSLTGKADGNVGLSSPRPMAKHDISKNYVRLSIGVGRLTWSVAVAILGGSVNVHCVLIV